MTSAPWAVVRKNRQRPFSFLDDVEPGIAAMRSLSKLAADLHELMVFWIVPLSAVLRGSLRLCGEVFFYSHDRRLGGEKSLAFSCVTGCATGREELPRNYRSTRNLAVPDADRPAFVAVSRSS